MVSSEQNAYKVLKTPVPATQQKAVNYEHSSSEEMSERNPKFMEPCLIDTKTELTHDVTMSGPFSDSWDEDYIALDKYTEPHNMCNTTKKSHSDNRNRRKLEYLEFIEVETLQQDRVQVVAHPQFDEPVLIKIDNSSGEFSSLQREAMVYQILHGSGITPEFLGHVTEAGRPIGFITEYIKELPSIRAKSLKGCLAVLHALHRRGISHGDAHDGNCITRGNGSSVLIDFELSVETTAQEEFERDLDIMGRCIQATLTIYNGVDLEKE